MSNDNNPFRYKAQALRFFWTSAVLVLCLTLACIAVITILAAL